MKDYLNIKANYVTLASMALLVEEKKHWIRVR
jgi:hypothetical protein